MMLEIKRDLPVFNFFKVNEFAGAVCGNGFLVLWRYVIHTYAVVATALLLLLVLLVLSCLLLGLLNHFLEKHGQKQPGGQPEQPQYSYSDQ
jgi:hypothetical protein